MARRMQISIEHNRNNNVFVADADASSPSWVVMTYMKMVIK